MQLREDNNDDDYDDCEWKSKVTMVMTLMTMIKKFINMILVILRNAIDDNNYNI